MKKRILIIASLVVMMAGLVGVIQPQAVGAVPNNNREDKVRICHRTNSVINPYNSIEVNESAVDGISGNSGNQADHYGEHQGPIASSAIVAAILKLTHTEWGDIIPPVEGAHAGLNWTTIGQAMWTNGCNYVTAATPAEVTFIDPTCETLGVYTIPKTKGVRYLIEGNVVANGEYSAQPGETVTVTAEAKTGYYLTGQTEWSHLFITPEDCEEEGLADIKYGVVCSANGAVVTLTNDGDVAGDATVNGEVISVAAGATVERTFDTTDAGLQITITINEQTVYDQVVTCDTGDVLGDTDVLPTTSGSIASVAIAAVASFALIAGLISLAVRTLLTRQ